MHPTYRVLAWKAAALACLSFVATATNAQEPVPQPGQGPATTKVGQINALVVAINGTKRVSMRSKRLIRSVNVEKENIARAQAIQDDPMSVLVIGLQAGTTRLRLTDDQGTEEVIDVVVELDIEVVKTVLRRAFPTANVEPIPTGTTTIVLVGNVAHAEEIEAILRVAQGVLASGLPVTAQSATGGGTGGAITVVNAMTVGGVRQVQLDVVVAQVNRTELRNLGVNFTVQGTTAFGGSLIGSLAQAGQSTGSGAASTSILGARAFLDSLTPGGATNIVAGIVPAGINTFIQALRQERLAKLLAEPRLITISGRPATMNAGGQQAVPEVTASGVGGGTVGTRFEPFGTQLTFIPIVLGNGKIYLEVDTSVTSLNAANGFAIGGIVVAGRDEQRVRSEIMMEPGQTFAIGGLIQTQTSGQTNKVPVLGDLPFIGTVFSTTTFTDTEQELVVLVTPYLVDAMDCRQAPCKLPGMETRSPDDFELFLELILEAPRGQREVFPNKHYQPAWMNGPSADKFPCGGAGGQCSGSGGNGRCAKGGSCQSGCGNGSCGTATWTPPPPPNSGKATAAGATGSPNSAEWVLPVTTTTQYPNLDGKP